MKISNQNYDIGKWLVLIFLPAFAFFISGIGELYSWVNASTIVSTVNIFTVFLGSVLQISSQKYDGGNGSPGGRTIEK